MDKLKTSPAVLLEKVEVQTIEMECLHRVFDNLVNQTQKSEKEGKGKIGPQDLMKVLTNLGLKLLKSEVALYIWEVDDDLDGFISWDEYMRMYKRSISDETGLEPRRLFNLVQFLMYDKEFKGKVTVEETLQIMYVRYGREHLDDEIEKIFGREENNADGSEKTISFGDYCEKVNERALDDFKRNKKKKVVMPGDE